jgi:DNA-binding MarR family transcriptional regulator
MPKPTKNDVPASPSGATQRGGSDGGCEHPLADIDQVLHAPARLMIATHLYIVDAEDAVFLQNMTDLTWGNLSSHLRKLEEAGYIAIEKSFKDRKPRTAIALTDKGRTALRDYRAAMLRSLEPLNP